jgi:hypothetical protein
MNPATNSVIDDRSRGWRRLVWGCVGCLALGVISLMPIIVVGLSRNITTPTDSLVMTNVLLMILLWGSAGVVLGVMAILIGVWGLWRRWFSWKTVLWHICGVFGLGLATVIALTLAGPAIGQSSLFYLPGFASECSYHVIVVAYIDLNHNNLRDNDEPGVAQVPVTVTVETKSRPQMHTDNAGVVEIEAYAFLCDSPSDQIMVSIGDPVEGYQMSQAQPEPFPVTLYPAEPPTRVFYVGFVGQ